MESRNFSTEDLKQIFLERVLGVDARKGILSAMTALNAQEDMFDDISLIEECERCEGSGRIDIDVSWECRFQPANECCGGCTKNVICDACDGAGEIEFEI